MIEFDINTPKRIAAFLAQIEAEGNLAARSESFIYSSNTASRLANLFKSAFSYNYNYNNHSNAVYRANLVHDRYNDDSRTRLQNAQLFYNEIIAPALSATGGHWTGYVQSLIANRVYSSDHGTGYERGNGVESTGDGWKYRGRGQIQLTGKALITQFADYVRTHYLVAGQTAAQAAQLAQNIVINPSIIDTDPVLSARSAAWYWSTHKAKHSSLLLNDKALMIQWSNSQVNLTQQADFNKISLGINPGGAALQDRWVNYTQDVIQVLNGGNPYESMRIILSRIGFMSTVQENYSQQFGVTLSKRAPLVIEGTGSQKLLAEVDDILSEKSDKLDLTPEQETRLWERAEPLFEQLKQVSEGGSDMWIYDTGLLVGAVITMAASPVQATDNYLLGRCQISRPNSGAKISPVVDGDTYMLDYRSDDIRYKKMLDSGEGLSGAKVTLIKAPEHGKVTLRNLPDAKEFGWYQYWPETGYIGHDLFVIQVEKDGV